MLNCTTGIGGVEMTYIIKYTLKQIIILYIINLFIDYAPKNY